MGCWKKVSCFRGLDPEPGNLFNLQCIREQAKVIKILKKRKKKKKKYIICKAVFKLSSVLIYNGWDNQQSFKSTVNKKQRTPLAWRCSDQHQNISYPAPCWKESVNHVKGPCWLVIWQNVSTSSDDDLREKTDYRI